MSFKENLKSLLQYKNMMVKELAANAGIRRHTLDNYLNTHNSIPNAEAAVKIARALGVSVEYLITGTESYDETKLAFFPSDIRAMLEIGSSLSPENRKIALALLKSLKEQQKT